ncbi:MAG: DNA translocase FtsK 4TM domain-containing protein [Verrucomicrobia bacterium]|nr:DNA translocase FtsK 4TM domain-containing protein [Verrucomicrobiota bacterium]
MALKRQRDNLPASSHRHRELRALLWLSIAALVWLALYFYSPARNPMLTTSVAAPGPRYTGVIGSAAGYVLLFLLGLSAYLIPLFLVVHSVLLFVRRPMPRLALKVLLLAALGTAAACLLDLGRALVTISRFGYLADMEGPGGYIGHRLVTEVLRPAIGTFGTATLATLAFVASLVGLTEVQLYPAARALSRAAVATGRAIARGAAATWASLVRLVETVRNAIHERRERRAAVQAELDAASASKRRMLGSGRAPATTIIDHAEAATDGAEKRSARKRTAKPKPEPARPPRPDLGSYRLPPMDLLETGPQLNKRDVADTLRANAAKLEETLRHFNIEATVGEIHRGPVITRYELHPAPGVKVQSITQRADDLALALKALSVRIIAPIPGRGVVGIEIPNDQKSFVYLKDVIASETFRKFKGRIPVAIGKSVDGEVVLSDLAEMPHLLIAGTTGSGKSVCINSLITTLLYTMRPDELKLILIDPKKVELSDYNGLPHMLVPVITEAKKVAAGLFWLVKEMEKRYDYLSEAGVRNIEAYNARPIQADLPVVADENGEAKDPMPNRLPYIIAVIDELADLMMIAPAEIENAIRRLAQLSRAVGIHLVFATQRPSVDVITGVIKANFPTRIAFQVASKVDSRTVIDTVGAEKLIGNGDCLFLPPGSGRLVRAQATFLSDAEMKRVFKYIKDQAEPDYDESVLSSSAASEDADGELFDDDLFDKAVELVKAKGIASASFLQRRMHIGYARAGRLVDLMESRGIVGPARGSKPREVLVGIDLDQED